MQIQRLSIAHLSVKVLATFKTVASHCYIIFDDNNIKYSQYIAMLHIVPSTMLGVKQVQERFVCG